MHEIQLLPILLTIKEQLGTLEAKVDGIREDERIATKHRESLSSRISSLETSRSKMHGVVIALGALAGAISSKFTSFLGLN